MSAMPRGTVFVNNMEIGSPGYTHTQTIFHRNIHAARVSAPASEDQVKNANTVSISMPAEHDSRTLDENFRADPRNTLRVCMLYFVYAMYAFVGLCSRLIQRME